MRLTKTLLIYMKMCISQEVSRVSGKSRHDACSSIRKMAGDQRLLRVIDKYPCKRLGFAQRAFVELLKQRAANVLYMAAALGFF